MEISKRALKKFLIKSSIKTQKRIKRETTTVTSTKNNQKTIPWQKNNHIIPRKKYLKDSDRL